MPTAIFTTDEAREFLAGNAGDLANESLVQEYIDAATIVIEDASRPAASESRTYVVNGGGRAILVPVPFVSVTSVTEAGSALVSTDYTADGSSGVIWRGSTTSPAPYYWSSGIGNVSVTVTVGSAGTVPANITLAAKELLKHMWSRRQGPRPALGVPGVDQTTTPAGYLIPNYVAALLAPSPALPGFA